MTEQYLIWSNEHRAWWGAARQGYVKRVDSAGVYSHEEALGICTGAMLGRRDHEPLHELPVRFEDVLFMLQRFEGSYPGKDPEPSERGDER